MRRQMQAMLVHGGGGAAAKLCMDQMIRISQPWVAAVAKLKMVHQGLTKVGSSPFFHGYISDISKNVGCPDTRKRDVMS